MWSMVVISFGKNIIVNSKYLSYCVCRCEEYRVTRGTCFSTLWRAWGRTSASTTTRRPGPACSTTLSSSRMISSTKTAAPCWTSIGKTVSRRREHPWKRTTQKCRHVGLAQRKQDKLWLVLHQLAKWLTPLLLHCQWPTYIGWPFFCACVRCCPFICPPPPSQLFFVVVWNLYFMRGFVSFICSCPPV